MKQYHASVSIWRLALLLCLVSPILFSSSHLVGQEVDYVRDVQPLLIEKCVSCDGALREESGLRLDHGDLIRRGGDGGSVIAFDAATQSSLLERVSSEDSSTRMPPECEGQPLSAEQIRVLVQRTSNERINRSSGQVMSK